MRDPLTKKHIEALKNEDAGVRWFAAEALGTLGDPAAVLPLIRALKDKNRDVRSNAAAALGKLGDSRSLPRAVLSYAAFSTPERIAILERLRHAKYRRNGELLLYSFPDTRTLCQTVLGEGSPEARSGA